MPNRKCKEQLELLQLSDLNSETVLSLAAAFIRLHKSQHSIEEIQNLLQAGELIIVWDPLEQSSNVMEQAAYDQLKLRSSQ